MKNTCCLRNRLHARMNTYFATSQNGCVTPWTKLGKDWGSACLGTSRLWRSLIEFVIWPSHQPGWNPAHFSPSSKWTVLRQSLGFSVPRKGFDNHGCRSFREALRFTPSSPNSWVSRRYLCSGMAIAFGIVSYGFPFQSTKMFHGPILEVRSCEKNFAKKLIWPRSPWKSSSECIGKRRTMMRKSFSHCRIALRFHWSTRISSVLSVVLLCEFHWARRLHLGNSIENQIHRILPTPYVGWIGFVFYSQHHPKTMPRKKIALPLRKHIHRIFQITRIESGLWFMFPERSALDLQIFHLMRFMGHDLNPLAISTTHGCMILKEKSRQVITSCWSGGSLAHRFGFPRLRNTLWI